MVLPSLPALSATAHDVEMLNKDPDDKKRRMLFKPIIQVVEPGDTVKFLPTDKGHNSASLKGMIPEGTEAWKGKINKEIEVTFEKPGFYGYQCTPHYSIGMVGLVICKGDGMMDNLEAAQGVKQRGKAKKTWAAIWEQAEADGLLA
ncbi:MAG: pseudoazurin [Pseudomonadota bacterium]